MIFPLRRLFWPFVVSTALHAGILVLAMAPPAKRPSPRIEVRLPQLPERRAEPLLKNTLPEATAEAAAESRTLEGGRGRNHARNLARQRLAEHVFYPPIAVEQGLEGEVRLLLRLDKAGKVVEARVASSSGHDLLDRAALDAASAAGAFPNVGSELILPVVFRLSE